MRRAQPIRGRCSFTSLTRRSCCRSRHSSRQLSSVSSRRYSSMYGEIFLYATVMPTNDPRSAVRTSMSTSAPPMASPVSFAVRTAVTLIVTSSGECGGGVGLDAVLHSRLFAGACETDSFVTGVLHFWARTHHNIHLKVDALSTLPYKERDTPSAQSPRWIRLRGVKTAIATRLCRSWPRDHGFIQLMIELRKKNVNPIFQTATVLIAIFTEVYKF